MTYQLTLGDCLDTLPTLESNTFDSLVTDPPAGIGFMGKDWDSNKGGRVKWIDWLTSVMAECLRVLKPGSHALVWALPRTSHWTATAIEQAGFEVRDVVTHLFGQGFPKSHDISKAIDKEAGAEREVVGYRKIPACAVDAQPDTSGSHIWTGELRSNQAITDAARQWQGWGTTLKPACENWILARKPLSERSIAANVLKWGTGGLNIDGCRIGSRKDKPQRMGAKKTSNTYGKIDVPGGKLYTEGRFPANVLCSDPDLIGEQARFFYCPKASRREKNAGLEGLPEGANRINAPRSCEEEKFSPQANHHPTVKPLGLMRYLCRLITPPGGTVLDCFCGSGSTGVAALEEGFGFVGIEADKAYLTIAQARCQSKPSNNASK